MRLSLRFVVPLVAVLALIAYASIHLADRLTLRWFIHDLDDRAHLIAAAAEFSLKPLLREGDKGRLARELSRLVLDERMYALGICVQPGALYLRTNQFPLHVTCPAGRVKSEILKLPLGPLHVSFEPLGESSATLVLVHDMKLVTLRTAATRRYLFGFFILLGVIISSVTVLIAQASWRGWLQAVRSILKRDLLRGDLGAFNRNQPGEVRPLIKDLRTLLQGIQAGRPRDMSQEGWSAKSLKEILQRELRGDEILVVSNREPYIHVKKGDKIEVQVPASGLVTALEPVMRACSGTWVAHGSGSGDRESVDAHDRVRVPPDDPSYQIRRVWLTAEEEAGFYYGFANEGLWPLCHIAYTRPVFRTGDWQHYLHVNEKFADAVVEEAKTDDPVILIQDYHFAALPALLKKRLPRSTIITFWHIPWANPESFGICPWREEILEGLLGSDILGFHTRFHCTNFIDAVDRFLESRIDRDSATITHGGKITLVQNYPISIDFPARWFSKLPSVADCRKQVRERLGIGEKVLLGVGVDRLDYTKGIAERFRAVERLLELEPGWIGRFSFVQIAAPSRTKISRYRNFGDEVADLAESINRRFRKDGYQPIYLLAQHHEPWQVYEYFRAAQVCVVLSLHDGMNLVAKEFVASRDDEQGVLVLSQFTGAAREMAEALIVNPYDTDQCAAALQFALEMSPAEQQARIRSMRALIQEFNIYRWAGRMLLDAAKLRRRKKLTRKISHSEESQQFLPV